MHCDGTLHILSHYCALSAFPHSTPAPAPLTAVNKALRMQHELHRFHLLVQSLLQPLKTTLARLETMPSIEAARAAAISNQSAEHHPSTRRTIHPQDQGGRAVLSWLARPSSTRQAPAPAPAPAADAARTCCWGADWGREGAQPAWEATFCDVHAAEWAVPVDAEGVMDHCNGPETSTFIYRIASNMGHGAWVVRAAVS